MWTTSFPGSQFIDELRHRDGLDEVAAKAWIEKHSGQRFDPMAMYKLRWSGHSGSGSWTEAEDLRVHVMYNSELAAMEREVRKYNKMPPRKPWDPWMFESAMDRSRIDRSARAAEDRSKK